jgi:hypothetical protein
MTPRKTPKSKRAEIKRDWDALGAQVERSVPLPSMAPYEVVIGYIQSDN